MDAFLCFCRTEGEGLLNQLGDDTTYSELEQALEEKWKSADGKMRQFYEDMSFADGLRYEDELAEWKRKQTRKARPQQHHHSPRASSHSPQPSRGRGGGGRSRPPPSNPDSADRRSRAQRKAFVPPHLLKDGLGEQEEVGSLWQDPSGDDDDDYQDEAEVSGSASADEGEDSDPALDRYELETSQEDASQWIASLDEDWGPKRKSKKKATTTKTTAAAKQPKQPKKPKENIPPGQKKPLAPFIIFCQSERTNLRKKRPDLNFAGLGRELGEMWRKLSDEERESYREEAKENRDKYNQNKPNEPDKKNTGKNNSSSNDVAKLVKEIEEEEEINLSPKKKKPQTTNKRPQQTDEASSHQSLSGGNSTTKPSKRPCVYGSKCYRQENPQHTRDYSHP